MFTRRSFILKSAGVCLLAAAVIGAATTEPREPEDPSSAESLTPLHRLAD